MSRVHAVYIEEHFLSYTNYFTEVLLF